MTDICLVSMPYSSLNGPSIALGLLKGALKGTEIEVSILYPNIWFAEEIGLDNYMRINGISLEITRAVKEPVASIPNTPAESPGGYIDIVQYQLELGNY
jgi:hypothetical protein